MGAGWKGMDVGSMLEKIGVAVFIMMLGAQFTIWSNQTEILLKVENIERTQSSFKAAVARMPKSYPPPETALELKILKDEVRAMRAELRDCRRATGQAPWVLEDAIANG